MFRGAKKAFTIIEILLFIAISGLMIAVAMNSIGSSQQNVQFTDSMRSLQSFIETQVSAAANGVNDRPVDAACGVVGSGDCVMLGRVLMMEKGSSSIRYQTLLGKRLTSDNEADIVASGSSSGYLFFSEPELEGSVRDYDLVWGSVFIGGSHKNTTGGDNYSQVFAVVRNPRSSAVSTMTYGGTDGDTLGEVAAYVEADSTYNLSAAAPIVSSGQDAQAYYCFESADGKKKAAITVVGSTIDLVFESSPDFTYSCS
jgi:type II secretory pathway pseudopilin PulG